MQDDNKPYISQGPNDLFEGELAQSLLSSMSEEDKARYQKIGQQLYGEIDFVNSKNNLPSQMVEAAARLKIQLNSGLHPSVLEDNEKMILEETLGKKWYTNWGYVEKDLTEIYTLEPKIFDI